MNTHEVGTEVQFTDKTGTLVGLITEVFPAYGPDKVPAYRIRTYRPVQLSTGRYRSFIRAASDVTPTAELPEYVAKRDILRQYRLERRNYAPCQAIRNLRNRYAVVLADEACIADSDPNYRPTRWALDRYRAANEYDARMHETAHNTQNKTQYHHLWTGAPVAWFNADAI